MCNSFYLNDCQVKIKFLLLFIFGFKNYTSESGYQYFLLSNYEA